MSHKITEKLHLPCLPKKHIYYFKIYKTGSSTFSNILNRIILKHNLTTFQLGHLNLHPKAIVNKQTDARFDVNVNHGKYTVTTISKWMKADTLHIASIRHPFKRAISSVYFRNDIFNHKRTETELEEWLEKIMKTKRKTPMYEKLLEVSVEYDPMNHTHVLETLKAVETQFHYIIVNEFYDESLVLLKHKLCWNTKDILYVTHKNMSRKYEFYGEKQQSSYDKLLSIHKNAFPWDYALYEYFFESHKRSVQLLGTPFQRELKEYKHVNFLTNLFCKDIYEELTKENIDDSIWIRNLTFSSLNFSEPITINSYDCVVMALDTQHMQAIKMALNYPLACTMNIKGVHINKQFCSPSKKGIFLYNNTVFVPEYILNQINRDL